MNERLKAISCSAYGVENTAYEILISLTDTEIEALLSEALETKLQEETDPQEVQLSEEY